MGARRRGPRAAAAAAGLALAVTTLTACGSGTDTSPSGSATSSPVPPPTSSPATASSGSSTVTPSPSSDATGSASPTDPTGVFGTAPVSGGTAYPGPEQAHLERIGVGSHTGYDRLVLYFGTDAVPSFTVSPQSSPVFPQDPSDVPVTLGGTSGVRVVVQSTVRANATVEDLRPLYPAIRQVRGIGDFEATVSYGVGVLGPARVRVTTLTGPNRLVVDVAWPDPA